MLLLTPFSIAWSCFALLPILTMPRSEMTKTLQGRDLCGMAAGLALLVIVVICCNSFISNPVSAAAQKIVHHPAFVGAFWAVMLWALYRLYRRQKADVTV